MVELSTNVLVIGKSGVGKSSLLNYMLNKNDTASKCVFAAIIRNLWSSLKMKVPYNIKKQVQENFDNERRIFESEITTKRLLLQRTYGI